MVENVAPLKKKKINHDPEKEKMKYPKEKGLQNDHFQSGALSSSAVLQGLRELLFLCQGFKLGDRVKKDQR